jgi:hypothetical protein
MLISEKITDVEYQADGATWLTFVSGQRLRYCGTQPFHTLPSGKWINYSLGCKDDRCRAASADPARHDHRVMTRIDWACVRSVTGCPSASAERLSGARR